MSTAPLVRIADTGQAADVKSSKAPSPIWQGYARVKTYVKDDEWGPTVSPREVAFEQPYQIASRQTGRPWTETNPVYLGELHGCNLRCPYCYLDWDGDTPTVDVSPEQYVEDFLAFNRAENTAHRPGTAVLRWSGGEPMLFQDWLADSIRHFGSECWDHYGWLDTNLTISPSDDLLTAMDGVPMGVCGCFKPGVEGVDLDAQLDIAARWLSASPTQDVFFYYTSWGGSADEFEYVLDGLREIHRNAPLRLTVIEIKWSYSAMSERRGAIDPEMAVRQFRRRREQHLRYLTDHYSGSILAMPSDVVPID